MDIMELGAIGELVGGVAVIGSLLYVGLQIRQNSSWLRASVVDSSSQRLTEMHYFMAQEGNREILEAIAVDPAELDPTTAARVGQVFMAIARGSETAYFQFQLGNLPQQLWDGYQTHVHLIASTRFFEPWWGTRKEMFHQAFRELVEHLVRGEHLDVDRIANPVGK